MAADADAAELLLLLFVKENWIGTDELLVAGDCIGVGRPSSDLHFDVAEGWCGGGIVRLLTSTSGMIRPPADLTSVAGTI